VLFDFFGTLTHAVQRGPAHAAIARRLGCDPVAFAAMLDATYAARARGGYGSAVHALQCVASALGARPGSRQLRTAAFARVLAVRADTRLRAEAVPLLRAVRARGLRTALVSDCTHELPSFLPSLPIAPLLDTCVYSVEVRACKPEPAIYLTACLRLGARPEECLYIGDGGSGELSGARAIGMDAVRLAAPDLARHLTFAPDRDWTGPQISHLDGALDVLDRERVLSPV
jgi:putative hydrolase of the HAD superfamily